MARIRSVKPEFWTDERVGECSPTARLLFIATWNFADDHGGLDRSAKQLKAQVFPYDTVDCEALICELLTAGLLIEYEVEGKKYLHIIGFRKHQKVEKPSKPRVPLYSDSLRTRRTFPDSSPSGSGSSSGSSSSGMEGSGREGRGGVEGNARAERSPTAVRQADLPLNPEGEAEPVRDAMGTQAATKAKRGTRIPEDFGLTPQMRAWAKSETPGVDVEAETAEFVDYWHTVPGQKGCKLDWTRTWQVRMRELQRRNKSRPSDRATSADGILASAWRPTD